MLPRCIDFKKLRSQSEDKQIRDVINILELMNLVVHEDPANPDKKNDCIRHLMKDKKHDNT